MPATSVDFDSDPLSRTAIVAPEIVGEQVVDGQRETESMRIAMMVWVEW